MIERVEDQGSIYFHSFFSSSYNYKKYPGRTRILEKTRMIWSLRHLRIKGDLVVLGLWRCVIRCFFYTFRLINKNFSLCSRDSLPYTDKICMDSQEKSSQIGYPGPPRSHEWIENLIYIRSHLNHPIYPSDKKVSFKPWFEQKEYAMLMCLGWSTSLGQALMSTLNYPCGW